MSSLDERREALEAIRRRVDATHAGVRVLRDEDRQTVLDACTVTFMGQPAVLTGVRKRFATVALLGCAPLGGLQVEYSWWSIFRLALVALHAGDCVIHLEPGFKLEVRKVK
jgi:hypothetical protein